ncbi:sensor histidine kinase [Modicisalibacter tunisiensis]|uniref:histidine kinase n=1 Tax=Modicisalibacter tunisiensis TaxID=390637 RepID=A0ABS7WV30_9GAMM|nr:HAMP domain-containing sensor histidine kinase [Modicisalibacter tunisiensis]MBZ9540142.1 HAMP domain-containing histidine kinase [Modicisalibacter tunisiensis]MBZ9566462.1 HAMP domain-containing histidine kinase [Modicisalibacter tunisiensis]
MTARLRAWLARPAGWTLGQRLLAAALALVLVVLPLAGLGLAYNFRESATAAFDQRLSSLLQVVLADLGHDARNDRLTMTRSLGDARFERVFSGWYWQVTDRHDTALVSRSLWDQRLPVTTVDGVSVRDIRGPRGEPLRVIERDVRLPGWPRTLHVSVAVSREELDAEVARFEWLLGLSLLALGALLLGGLALQIRWGLAPLRRLHADLERVESGAGERLDTRLPGELSELAGAMNEVLERDRRLIERGRSAAGNLAHALKTPVSVLRTVSERLPEAQRRQVHDELGRIDEAVRHHLARASAAGGATLTGRVRVGEAIAPVVDGLARLAGRRGIALERDLDDALTVRMDPQDLQELVGNLLDNALRWANSRVRLSLHEAAGAAVLCIEDDGPGMTAEQRRAALARGARLDEHRSGSGLGLAIVEDLMSLYGGSLSLETASLGGLAARVELPGGRTPGRR